MKKLKYMTLIPIGVGLLSCLKISASARIIPVSSYHSAITRDSFNVIAGRECNMDPAAQEYDHVNVIVGSYVETGTLINVLEGTVEGEDAKIKEILNFNGGELESYSYYFNDEKFYDAKIIDDEVEVYTDVEVDISSRYDSLDACFTVTRLNTDEAEEYRECGQPFYNQLDIYAFYFTGVDTYCANEYYKDKDIHIVTDCHNPLSIEEISAEIKASDNSGTVRYWIDENDYDPETAVTGTLYSFRYVAVDASNNISVQKFYVELKDVIDPTINYIWDGDIEVEYTEVLTEEDIFAKFHVTDDYDKEEDIRKELDISSYLATPDVLGDYPCKLTAYDTAGNDSSYSFIIHVKDTKEPNIILYAYDITTNINSMASLDEILANVKARDAHDGDVSDTLTMEDRDSYSENWNTCGIYHLDFSAHDKSGNSVTRTITLHNVDTDGPVITINKYAIFTEKGGTVSKEDVINLFKSLGYDIDDANVESVAFDEESLDGEYSLEIMKDGMPMENIITTEEDKKDDASYEIPENVSEDTGPNIPLIIGLSAGGLVILSGIIFGIILYKKKH